jgi:hypothetical protein
MRVSAAGRNERVKIESREERKGAAATGQTDTAARTVNAQKTRFDCAEKLTH